MIISKTKMRERKKEVNNTSERGEYRENGKEKQKRKMKTQCCFLHM